MELVIEVSSHWRGFSARREVGGCRLSFGFGCIALFFNEEAPPPFIPFTPPDGVDRSVPMDWDALPPALGDIPDFEALEEEAISRQTWGRDSPFWRRD